MKGIWGIVVNGYKGICHVVKRVWVGLNHSEGIGGITIKGLSLERVCKVK